MTEWVDMLLKCVDGSAKLPPNRFNQNHTKIGFLGFRVLRGGNNRKYLIEVQLIHLLVCLQTLTGFLLCAEMLLSAGDTRISER